MYKSYLVLINDYVLSLKKGIWFDIVSPLIIAIILTSLSYYDCLKMDKTFISNTLKLLGVLAGFSMTSIAILTSAKNKSIDKLKAKLTDTIVDGEEISLFRQLYILISYSVLICLITITINMLSYLIPWHKLFDKTFISILKGSNMFLILHILFLNIRNITSLYFFFFDETNKN